MDHAEQKMSSECGRLGGEVFTKLTLGGLVGCYYMCYDGLSVSLGGRAGEDGVRKVFLVALGMECHNGEVTGDSDGSIWTDT